MAVEMTVFIHDNQINVRRAEPAHLGLHRGQGCGVRLREDKRRRAASAAYSPTIHSLTKTLHRETSITRRFRRAASLERRPLH